MSSDRHTNKSPDSLFDKLDKNNLTNSSQSHSNPNELSDLNMNINTNSVINFNKDTYVPMLLEKIKINQDMVA